jgi:hypothetical protein
VQSAESEQAASVTQMPISAYRPPNARVADPRDDVAKMRHSGLGIASFVLACVSTVLILVLLVVAGVMEASTPGGMSETSPAAIAIGLLLFLFVFVALVGVGLGIAGLFQSERKKVFAVLGTVFGGVTLLGTASIVAIGMSVG